MLFDLTLHLGTLFAVCVVLRRQIAALFRRPFRALLYLIVASVPAAIVGVFLGDLVDQVFFGGAYLSLGFAVSAALLATAQLHAKRGKEALPLRFRCAACMGLAQAVAVIPGISRSGATVAAGMLSGGRREEVANFSFLMSIPVIAGGFIVSLVKGLLGGELYFAFSSAGSGFGASIAIALAASAVSGIFAIGVTFKCVASARYTAFIVYLCGLAVLCGFLSFSGLL